MNPPTLPVNPAFSHAVVVQEPTRTIYVGGQNAVNADGDIVGDDLVTQTAQTLDNVEAALTAAGATFTDIVRCTIAVVDGQRLEEGARAFAQRWGKSVSPPAITVYVVAALAHPRFLVEIDAIATR